MALRCRFCLNLALVGDDGFLYHVDSAIEDTLFPEPTSYTECLLWAEYLDGKTRHAMKLKGLRYVVELDP
jgi:hypothetical protein